MTESPPVRLRSPFIDDTQGPMITSESMKVRDPQAARRKLFEFALSQGGYFTATQAREAGYSKQLQYYHVKHGNWTREGRGMYRVWELPQTSFEDVARWVLWSGKIAVASHQTAMAVHEISDLMPAKIHLTVPPGFRKKPPPILVLHRDRLRSDETQQAEGFRVTTPLRTLLDAARVAVDGERLAGGVRDAIRKGIVDPRTIEAKVAELQGPAAERLLQALLETVRFP